jgi:hypothetical protein
MGDVQYLRDPINWMMAAEVQLRAASLLNETLRARLAGEGSKPTPQGEGVVDDGFPVDLELMRPILLLGGLALELAFKAVIIAQEPSAISDDGEPDWSRSETDHSLTKLAMRANLLDLEIDFLRRLEPFVIWGGLDPVGRDACSELSLIESYAGTHAKKVMREIARIYHLCRERISALLNDGPCLLHLRSDRVAKANFLRRTVRKYFVYRSTQMRMARLHSSDCIHVIRQRGKTAPPTQGIWLGPFESYDEAADVMKLLGLRNTGLCQQCKPLR